MLELSAAALSPAYAAVTNELLLTVKVWPGFAQARQRATYREAFAVERALSEAEAVGDSIPLALGRRAQKAADTRALKDEFLRRMYLGMHVGKYYYEALEGYATGAQFTVADLKQSQTRVGRMHPALDINPSTLRDALKDFRPACHLWAAHFMMKLELVPPDIGEYLELSEQIADLLLSIPIKQSHNRGRLLAPGTDLWRVPASLRPLLPPRLLVAERILPGSRLLDLLYKT